MNHTLPPGADNTSPNPMPNQAPQLHSQPGFSTIQKPRFGGLKSNFLRKYGVQLFLAVLTVIGIGAAYYLSTINQDVRQQASVANYPNQIPAGKPTAGSRTDVSKTITSTGTTKVASGTDTCAKCETLGGQEARDCIVSCKGYYQGGAFCDGLTADACLDKCKSTNGASCQVCNGQIEAAGTARAGEYLSCGATSTSGCGQVDVFIGGQMVGFVIDKTGQCGYTATANPPAITAPPTLSYVPPATGGVPQPNPSVIPVPSVSPTAVASPIASAYTCDSTCTISPGGNDNCKAINPNYSCQQTITGSRCRLTANPSSPTCQPVGASPSPSVRPSPTPSVIPTPSPSVRPSPSPSPVACRVPTPKDPPQAVCAPNASTPGTITWEWEAVRDTTGSFANQYRLEIFKSGSSSPVFTLREPGSNSIWVPASVYGCANGGLCRYTTRHTPGSYRSGIMAHATNGAGAPICSPSNWSYSQYMTIGICQTQDPQACVNTYADIVLVIDRSDSMNDLESGTRKLDSAKKAANTFIDSISGGRSSGYIRVSVVVFGQVLQTGDRSIYNTTVQKTFTNDYASVKTAINSIARTDSGTCVACGLNLANRLLADSKAEKYVVLLSDGGATYSLDGVQDLSQYNKAKTEAIAQAEEGRTKGITYFSAQYADWDRGERSPASYDAMLKIAGQPANYLFKPTVKEWATTLNEIGAKICR